MYRGGQEAGVEEGGIEVQRDVLEDNPSYLDLLREDGLSQEARNLALSLVMQIPSAADTVFATPGDECLDGADGMTVRLADSDDVKTICELRYAQMIEYRGLLATEESCRRFCSETEAYVRRNLGTKAHFALVEQAGEVMAMSGLEIADRMPSLSPNGNAERAATVVACYTLPQHRGKRCMRQMLSTWSTLAPLLGIDVIYLESNNPTMQILALNEGYDYVSEKYRFDVACSSQEATIASCETFVSAPATEHLPVG